MGLAAVCQFYWSSLKFQQPQSVAPNRDWTNWGCFSRAEQGFTSFFVIRTWWSNKIRNGKYICWSILTLPDVGEALVESFVTILLCIILKIFSLKYFQLKLSFLWCVRCEKYLMNNKLKESNLIILLSN